MSFERTESERKAAEAFTIGQTIYGAIRMAAQGNPEKMLVRTSHHPESSRYVISVGFVGGIRPQRISQYPGEQGELYCQVFVDISEQDEEIKLAYGGKYHASLTPFYARDPEPRYDGVETFPKAYCRDVAERLADEVSTAKRKTKTLADVFGEPSKN